MTRICTCLVVLITFLLSTNLYAQNQSSSERYANVDYVVGDLYAVISGPAGPRNWDKMKSLFHENASMGSVRIGQDGKRTYSQFTVDGYIERSSKYFLENGFFETEIGRRTETYGELTHLFSAYQSQRTEDGPVFSRGINSIQLVFEKGRWWIVSIQWNSEREGLPIPKDMDH